MMRVARQVDRGRGAEHDHDRAGGPGPTPATGQQLREVLPDDTWLDELIDRAEVGGVRLTGDGA